MSKFQGALIRDEGDYRIENAITFGELIFASCWMASVFIVPWVYFWWSGKEMAFK